MVPLVKKSADTLVDKFREKAESGESMEIMRCINFTCHKIPSISLTHLCTVSCRTYGAFTLESILAAAFGRVINLQRGEADEVTKAAKAVFDGGRGKFLLVAVFFKSKFILDRASYIISYMIL